MIATCTSTQTVYVSCSANVPCYMWFLARTAAVLLIATEYSANSSAVGSERHRSYGDTPWTPARPRTSHHRHSGRARDSRVSAPAGSSGSIAAVGLYLTFSVSLPFSVARRGRPCEEHKDVLRF